jgi:TM2 domain-containing membrane protein YozV
VADWFYIGNYGQLGPLTREQIDELIDGGVITRETYVWRNGMPQWQMADYVAELGDSFRRADPYMAPPPPPMTMPQMTTMSSAPMGDPSRPYGTGQWSPAVTGGNVLALKSDKSRVLAGLLNLLPPGGWGRLYLGYSAYGVLQLVLGVVTCGVLYLWSVIDGIVMLVGGVKYDGYGRVLED